MAATTKVSHPSVDERRARGKEARDPDPPSSHAGWMPSAIVRTRWGCWRRRTSPVSPTWCRSGTGGCWSHLSPSTGAATIMAADLDGTTGLQVQLCGDAHLSNWVPSPRPSGCCLT